MNRIHILKITMRMGEVENTIYPALLQDKKNLVLVDCGYLGSLPLLEEALHKVGAHPEDLTAVALTHHDHDHMGALFPLKQKYPHVKVLASALEEPFICGRKKSLRLRQAEERQASLPPEQQAFGKDFMAMLRRVEPVAVDEVLSDGQRYDWCGGCEIISTPGHMPGHISLYLPEQKTLITGDAMSLEDGKPALANPQFTLDIAQAERDLRRLLALGAETIICYHGGAARLV